MARIAIDARKIDDFGIGSYLQNLLADLARLGSEHEFLVFLPPRARLPVEAKHLRGVPVAAPSYGVAEHLWLPWLARRAGIDLYHAPHYVLPWFCPRPAVVTIHDLIHLKFPEYLPNRAALHYARTMIERAYRRAALVLTVSECSKRDLLESFGGAPERIRVIPNRVDDCYFNEPDAATLTRTRERWRLPRRFVLYTGNVKPHKNLERLVEAFARARSEPGLEDLHLVLIGNDLARYHGLRRHAVGLGVADHLRPLGYLPREELAAIYRLASVFAYPSLYEGFGLPPLEAMASGVPVVASQRSSLPEVLGDAALLVDPLAVEAIAAALLRVLTDGKLAQDLSARGRERARRYRGDEPTRAVLSAYHDAMQGVG